MISKSLALGGVSLVVGVILAIASLVVKAKTQEIDHSFQADEESSTLQERLNKIKQEKDELRAGYLSFIKAVNENPNNIALFLADSKLELAEYNRFNTIITKKLKRQVSILL